MPDDRSMRQTSDLGPSENTKLRITQSKMPREGVFLLSLLSNIRFVSAGNSRHMREAAVISGLVFQELPVYNHSHFYGVTYNV